MFSPVTAEMEQRAADILAEEVPGIRLSLSHEIGRIGFLERENATVMNACLVDLAFAVVSSFRRALQELKIEAPFFISQNDGTLMAPEHVERYPVLTFASGPTNSMRGAALLAGLKEAMVVDIGGTTSDVGMLMRGFPREAAVSVDIGGVRTNFRMPDVLAIGLGGGSLVRDDGARIGPDSVGYELTSRRRWCSAATCSPRPTSSSRPGSQDIGDRSRVKHLHQGHDRDRARHDPSHGRHGGRSHEDQRRADARDPGRRRRDPGLARPASALRTSCGPSIPRSPTRSAPQSPRSAAKSTGYSPSKGTTPRRGARHRQARGVRSGDRRRRPTGSSVKIVDVEDVPLAYLPGNATRIRVKAVGDLSMQMLVERRGNKHAADDAAGPAATSRSARRSSARAAAATPISAG